MLSRSDIRGECYKATYEKGDMLFRSQAVSGLEWETEMDAENEYELVHIRAGVRGSAGNAYHVDITVDDDYREIVDSECDCPAFYSYGGLCKHCVAVLLHWLEIRKSGSRLVQNSAAMQPAVRRTTYGFDGFLNYWSVREQGNVSPAQTKVTLQPILHFKGSALTAEFKIGTGRMYVVKSVGDLINSIVRRERVEYGKELNFTHNMDAFAEDSLPLVRFLLYCVSDEAGIMDTTLSYLYKRDLVLHTHMLDEFFDAVSNQVVWGDCSPDEKERFWEIVDRDKEISELIFTIKGETQGAFLQFPEMRLVCGRRYMYFLKEGKIIRIPRDRGEEVRELLKYLQRFRQREIFIANEDLTGFCRDMLPVLKDRFSVQMTAFQPEHYLPEEARFEIYLDAPEKDMIVCNAYSLYDQEGTEDQRKYKLFDTFDLNERRDLNRERVAADVIQSYFNVFDPESRQMVLAEDEDMLFELVSEGISRFQELGEVFISDRLKHMQVHSAPKVNVGISLSGDLLELKLSSEELPVDQLIGLLTKYDRRKKYYRLKDGAFIDLSDDSFAELADTARGLMLPDKAWKDGTAVVPRYRSLYLDGRLKEENGLSVARNKDFRSLIRNMKTVEDNDYEVPKELDDILRSYQKLGYRWIRTLKDNGFGGILADDMGLGKTLQVITYMLAEWTEHLRGMQRDGTCLSGPNQAGPKMLIVCPASLVYNWSSEIERFAPELPCRMAVGTAAQRRDIIMEAGTVAGGVWITSYELLRRDLELYTNESLHFTCEVIDEAQFIKNHTTQAAKAVKQVSADFKLALTGTPVENRLSELWSIFDYLMPGFLYQYSRFRDELEAPITLKQDEAAGERLQKMIRPFVLRRLKKDVLTDLPDKIEKDMYASMEGEQASLYEAHVQRLKMVLDKQTPEEYAGNQIQILSELTKLRQICCDPGLLFEGYKDTSAKTDLCLELIRNAVEGGHKLLLFSQFTSMLERIRGKLEEQGISYYYLDGATPKHRRLELVDAFNQDETSVFCISLKAGGTGLNLTAADIVIHFDPWWNVAVQSQATDRAHRIGQKNVVTVYRLITRDTIEEKIIRLQQRKKDLADQILGQEALGSGQFRKEELMQILL